MNNFPKTVSKLAMMLGALVCAVPEAAACGPSNIYELGLILGLLAAVYIGVPAAACYLLYRLFCFATGAGGQPLRGKVTVLSDQALGF